MTQPFRFEVKSYQKRIVIGCADEEQLAPQEVIFDVVAELPASASLLVDVPHPVFDYCLLTDAIDAACAAAGIKILQEPLAFDAMGRMFAASPLVQALEIFIRKTERYANTDWIGFRMHLTRGQWQALASEVANLRKSSAA
jgi:dihydroneopterin aldolase